MNNKGIAPIATIGLVFAGLAVLGGVFYYAYQSSLPPVVASPPSMSPHPPAPVPPSPSNPAPASPVSGAYLTPTTAPIGAVITIHGSGFAATGNTILMKNLTAASMKNRPSSDGKTITFTVPQYLGPDCKPNEMCPQFLVGMSPGLSYNVDVVSGSSTQSIGTFTLAGQ